MHPRVQVCLLPLSPPAMCSHCLAWASTGTASELTEKSWVSAMLVPFSSSPQNQDSPALAHVEEVPAEASALQLPLLSCTRDPLASPSQSPWAAGSQLGTSCHQCPSLCGTRTLHKEQWMAGDALWPPADQVLYKSDWTKSFVLLPHAMQSPRCSHCHLQTQLLPCARGATFREKPKLAWRNETATISCCLS